MGLSRLPRDRGVGSRQPGAPVFTLDYAWRTHVGLIRSDNEDAAEIDSKLGLVIVADGMGGAQAGEVASALAVEVIADYVRSHHVQADDRNASVTRLVDAIEEANLAIWRSGQAAPERFGMATTVVAASVDERWMAYAYVGDSRLYRLRLGRLELLSHDHSFIQDVIDKGFFRSRQDAHDAGIGDNILTRALGSSRHVEVSSGVAELASGDLYLICTDGLTSMVPEPLLSDVLTGTAGGGLEAAADRLLRIAIERGGLDNITVALIGVDAPTTRSRWG